MRAWTISGVAAPAMALASAAAFAGSDVSASWQFNGQSAASRVYRQGMVLAQAGATIGDGSSPGYLKEQQQLLNEPGYGGGNGAAHIGGGSNPGYLKQQKQIVDEPGYNIGASTAHVVDGSNSTNEKTQR